MDSEGSETWNFENENSGSQKIAGFSLYDKVGFGRVTSSWVTWSEG